MQALARVVASHMGGRSNHAALSRRYAQARREQRRGLVVPIGALSVGLARHRALLFKALADACELPCRMLRGPFIGVPLPTQTKDATCRRPQQNVAKQSKAEHFMLRAD